LADPKLDSTPKDFEVLKELLLRELSAVICQGIPIIFYVDPMEKMLEWTLGARCFSRLMGDILTVTRRSRVLFILSCRPDGKGDIEHYLEPGLFDARYIEHVPLGPLSPEEAQEAIKTPAARHGVILCEHLVQVVSGKCGGHPYNLQLACYHLWNYIESAGLLSHANIDLDDNTIEQILKNTQRTLFQEGFNDIEKIILKTLALARTPLAEQEVTTRTKLYFNVESNVATETLRMLLKKHGHRPIKCEDGRYGIAHDLFSSYIREHECEREEQELEVARSEVLARLLAWKLGDRTPLYSSTLALARKYLSTLTTDDDILEMMLISEGKTGNANALSLYVSQFGLERSKETLLWLLSNLDDKQVGIEILEIFLRAPEPLRTEAIFVASGHPNDEVRAKAIGGLKMLSEGLLTKNKAWRVIYSALRDHSPRVREAGICTSVEIQKHDWQVFRKGKLARNLVGKLGSMLSDPDENVARCASQHLVMIGEDGIKRLLSAAAPYDAAVASSEKPQARILALEALAKIDDRRVYPRAIMALRADVHLIRVKAIKILRDCKDPSAISALDRVLKDPHQSVDVCLAAIEALGCIGGATAAEVLAFQSTAANLKIRLAAISALGRLGKVSVPILGKLLRSKGPAQPTTENWEVWHKALSTLISIGPDAKDELLGLLHHPYGRVRRLAVQGLAQLNIAEAKEPIRKLLNDSDILVQREAVEAVGRLHDIDAGPLLAPLLCHKDTAIQDKAGTSLRYLGTEALKAVMQKFESPDSKTAEVYARLQEILNTLS